MLSNTTNRRIEWGDCDPAGIVFNPNFFAWFDHCTALLYEAAGWPKHDLLRQFGAAGCPLVATGATFLAPCRYGQDVTITSTVTDLRRSSFDVEHKLWLDRTLCVEGRETRVWTIRDPETGALRSAPIPDPVAARLRADERAVP